MKIKSPGGHEAENYRNRKGYFSLNVQTVSGPDTKVFDIVARWQGGVHDQTIFNNSNVKMRFERGDFGAFILVGDSGYRNTSYMATPFLNCANHVENLYNESQIRTRNVVERQYGIMKRRFPILSNTIQVNINTTQIIIVACAVLHNIAIDANDVLPAEEIAYPPNDDEQPDAAPLANNNDFGIVRIDLVANHFARLAAENIGV